MENFSITLKEYTQYGKQIGHVNVCSDFEDLKDKRVWIVGLYVAEAHRHNGIGTKLMNRVIDTCRKLAIHRVYLWCKPELIPFYKKFDAKSGDENLLPYELMTIDIDKI